MENDLELLGQYRIKQIAKFQMELDQKFAEEANKLHAQLVLRKITGSQFWESYKKSLTKSIGKNKKLLQDLIKKTDKTMKEQFKTAQQIDTKEKPKIDLKLPA